jgi:hypothetical protein
VIFLTFTWKSKREQALLAEQFGPAFEEHRRGTGFSPAAAFAAVLKAPYLPVVFQLLAAISCRPA